MSTKRPNRFDIAIIREAASNLAPKVSEWLRDNENSPNDSETSLEEIGYDLVKALKWSTDGYTLARELDGNYSPDAALVEILDEAGAFVSVALKKAEDAWVIANNIQPIPLGTMVRYPGNDEIGIGMVTQNHSDGKSTVTFTSVGQVKGSGFVVPWEKLVVQAPS